MLVRRRGSRTGRRASSTDASVGGISTIAVGRIGGVDDREFSATVAAITAAFGDPTRRDIYLFARASDRGVTATEVAEKFELHPNVARHHLDKLAAGGYVDVHVERAEGAGAGRPSKHYRATEVSDALDVPASARRPARDAARQGAGPAAARGRRTDGRDRRRAVRPVACRADGAGRGTPLPSGRHPRGGRRAHRPRFRRPRRGPGQLDRHHQRPLPARRRRVAEPGDLRRRPRHGARDAGRPLRRHRPRDHRRRGRWAKTPASLSSDACPAPISITRRPRRYAPRRSRPCSRG